MSELVEKLFAIHDALTTASIPHAFGGAVALAYCVEEPRGTRDLDVNIFVDAASARRTLACLPPAVKVTEDDVAKVERDRLLHELDRQYPHYGFARHKGYGAPDHLAALERYGPCREHRLSFAPVVPRSPTDRRAA